MTRNDFKLFRIIQNYYELLKINLNIFKPFQIIPRKQTETIRESLHIIPPLTRRRRGRLAGAQLVVAVAGPAEHALEENALEALAEVGVEDGVDEGVEGRVDVAEQGERLEEAGVGAEAPGLQQVDAEEGQPADDDAAHDDAEGARRTPLPAQRDLLPLAQHVARVGGAAPLPLASRALPLIPI